MKTLLFVALTFLAIHATPASAAAPQNGQQDFDWEIGTWDTQLKRLRQPLSGKTEWLDYAGTSVIVPVMDKRANLVELDVRGPAGRITGVSLRLYQPATGQWTLNFANLANGVLTDPMVGAFQQGHAASSCAS
jgi:hypothetical protein